MLPVRCYTCNAIIAQHCTEYNASVMSGTTPADALDQLGLSRMCCRRMFLGYIDLITEQTRYGNVDRVLDDGGTILRRERHGDHVVACD